MRDVAQPVIKTRKRRPQSGAPHEPLSRKTIIHIPHARGSLNDAEHPKARPFVGDRTVQSDYPVAAIDPEKITARYGIFLKSVLNIHLELTICI